MPAASVLPPASCALNPHESLFSFLISEIIVSGMLSPGSIVDCGAHKGGEACLYASLAPARTVHAIEPQGMHISTMTRQYGSYLPNLRPLKGGLGSRDRTASVHGAHSPSMLLNVHARPDANASSRHINIHKLDTLYLDGGFFASERLGFAHFDVEGSEEDLLLGAQRVLQRDRPTFTLELMLRARQAGTTGEFTAARLIREVDRLGYQVLFVPEQCGIPIDCRNVICVPKERVARVPALVTQHTVPVDASAEYSPVALMRIPMQRGPPGNETAWKFRQEGRGAAAWGSSSRMSSRELPRDSTSRELQPSRPGARAVGPASRGAVPSRRSGDQ